MLKWQLGGATEKVKRISEGCKNIGYLCTQLKSDREELLSERDLVWKISNDCDEMKIQQLMKDQLDLSAEQATLQKEEMKNVLSCGTLALKLVIFLVGVICLI
eukprot:3413473-Ditylum_brightwellii.AAC.1